MTLDELKHRQVEKIREYDQLDRERTQLNNKAQDIMSEMLRVQGEVRVLDELIKLETPKEESLPVSSEKKPDETTNEGGS